MVINSITGIGSSSGAQNAQRINDGLQSAIARLVTGTRTSRISDDVAALSVATQLQTELSSLREVSGNVAQNISQLQVADGGAEQIGGLVQELRDLALQAKSPTINDQARASLNKQFQQIVSEIDRIADNTNFGGKKLLDGSVSGDNDISIGDLFAGEGEGGGASLSIDSLSSDALFNGQSLNILSTDNATKALDALATALGRVTGARADIGAFQQSLGFVAVSLDIAVSNQEAARSALADADITEETTIYSLLNAQRNANLALSAQTNRLPAGLLKLVE